jgi:hypothetical protein
LGGSIVVFIALMVLGTLITLLPGPPLPGTLYSIPGLLTVLVVSVGVGATFAWAELRAKMVIIAFFLQPRDTFGGQAELVTDLSGDARWEERLRTELGLAKAEVRLFREDEWPMPDVASVAQLDDPETLTEVVAGMAIALDRAGVADDVVRSFVKRDFETLRGPVSGRVILFQAVEAQSHRLGRLLQAGDPAPGQEAEPADELATAVREEAAAGSGGEVAAEPDAADPEDTRELDLILAMPVPAILLLFARACQRLKARLDKIGNPAPIEGIVLPEVVEREGSLAITRSCPPQRRRVFEYYPDLTPIPGCV